MLSRKAQARRREAERESHAAALRARRAPDYKLDYLTDPRPTCPRCSLPKDAVEERVDPFVAEGICWTDGPQYMLSCRCCYDERRMEV